jgi:hypothetical protein
MSIDGRAPAPRVWVVSRIEMLATTEVMARLLSM